MRLIFTKRDGKYDDLVIERAGRPHDMIHYAVESTLARSGFLSLVAQGQAAAFATEGSDPEKAIERLVENFQAEMWGGRVAAEDLIASYEHACDAHGHS